MSMSQLRVGDQVEGVYVGHAFRGCVAATRALTVKSDGAIEFMVELAEPVEIFGLKRDQILLVAKADGSPSSYTRHTDRLQVRAG